jgi:acyl carrier protein
MEIEEKVFSKVAETLGVEKDQLELETTFDSLGADSLDMVEFSMDVEEEFGVVIEQSDIAAINTLGDAIEFIKNKKA